MVMSRRIRVYDGENLVEESFVDVSWERFRKRRDRVLEQTDVYALPDRTLSDNMRNYRQFLRDLPQNHPGDNANNAVDAWDEYETPDEIL